MGWCHLQIFFSRTTKPEEFIFTWKRSIQYRLKIVHIMVLWGREGLQ
jgi:hypothetical protein